MNPCWFWGACAPFLFAASAAAQSTERVSVDSAGLEGDLASSSAAVSADGLRVAFISSATNLVAGDANAVDDVFLRDRGAGTTVRVSVNSLAAEANGASTAPAISCDGRLVAFVSLAGNLVAGDLNGAADVFVHDLAAGATKRVSIATGGAEANGASGHPGLSADGRYLCFSSVADNLVAGDLNGVEDVFLHDRETGVTVRVSVDSSGAEANAGCAHPAISADGRFVAFDSAADNLVAGDANGVRDVFVHDVLTGITERVSVGHLGAEANGDSQHPALSADGRLAAFDSAADNLVAVDGNAARDIFVRDRAAAITTRESIATSGIEGNLGSERPHLTTGGRMVVFESDATNLVAGDLNGARDVFLHNRLTGATERINRDGGGAEANGPSARAKISADGRYVAFDSSADNLVAGDLNAADDVFLRDRGAAGAVTTDSIVLTAQLFFAPGNVARFAWCNATAGAPWWLLYSPNNAGTSYGAHPFGVGPGVTVVSSGTIGPDGNGEYSTPPIPAVLSGNTVYFELAARVAGDYRESNTVERRVQ